MSVPLKVNCMLHTQSSVHQRNCKTQTVPLQAAILKQEVTSYGVVSQTLVSICTSVRTMLPLQGHVSLPSEVQKW